MRRRLIPCLLALMLFAGCSPASTLSEPEVSQGSLDKSVEHVFTPKAGETARVYNRVKPEGEVFLFTNADGLTHCFAAIESGQDMDQHCTPAIEAKVEDNAVVRLLDCESYDQAICHLQMVEGESAGVKGFLMWDWLKPNSK